MSTSVQIPYTNQLGDGSKVLFTYEFSIVEHADLYVTVDGIQMTEYSDYTLQNVTDDGGEVLFFLAPEDVIVSIFRRTTISQEVDYEAYSSFPADTHEWNLDKITYILQELINGTFYGVDDDNNPVLLSFDLEGVAFTTTVEVQNSGGTDATLPMWVSGETAGVYAGEYVPEANLPADGSATTQPDGYVILGHN